MNKFKEIIKSKRYALCLLLAMCCVLSGCAGGYKPLTVNVKNGQFVATGVIDETTPKIISQAIVANPSIETFILEEVLGSVDDEANLVAARVLRKAGIKTIVPEYGVVASGGTDLFLAGKERIIAPGACVGVHTWATTFSAGNEVPKDDPQHQLYLSYYDEMGIPLDFYWFTLDAAPVDDIYFMSPSEMNTFNMSTQPLNHKNKESTEQKYKRCIMRLIETE